MFGFWMWISSKSQRSFEHCVSSVKASLACMKRVTRAGVLMMCSHKATVAKGVLERMKHKACQYQEVGSGSSFSAVELGKQKKLV